MKKLDYVLRDWRHRMAETFVPPGSRLLDIGGFDGSFLRRVSARLASGTCVDPSVDDREEGKFRFVRCRISDRLPFPDASFDVITMLAVFEHLSACREQIAGEAFRVLAAGGRVVLTIPSSAVDDILEVLIRLRLIDGMATEEHEHFRPGDAVGIFQAHGFALERWSRFQLGLNNLFVFRKSGAGQPG